QVGGDGGLPRPTLAGRDRRYFAEIRELHRGGWRGHGSGRWTGTELPGCGRPRGRAGIGEGDAHGRHTRHALHRLACFTGQRRWVCLGEDEREGHLPRSSTARSFTIPAETTS